MKLVAPTRLGRLARMMKRKRAAESRQKNSSRIGAMRIADPALWESMIRAAMGRHDGNVREAAEELGISSRQLWRYLQDPRFDDIERAPKGNPNF